MSKELFECAQDDSLEDKLIADLIEERMKNDDGTRYSYEEVDAMLTKRLELRC